MVSTKCDLTNEPFNLYKIELEVNLVIIQCLLLPYLNHLSITSHHGPMKPKLPYSRPYVTRANNIEAMESFFLLSQVQVY